MAQYWLVQVSFNRLNYFSHNQVEIYQYKLAVTVTRLGEIGKLGSVDGQLCCWSVDVMSQTYRTVLKSFKWNSLHTITMMCRYVWHNLCEARLKDSRVMPLSWNSFISLYPYLLGWSGDRDYTPSPKYLIFIWLGLTICFNSLLILFLKVQTLGKYWQNFKTLWHSPLKIVVIWEDSVLASLNYQNRERAKLELIFSNFFGFTMFTVLSGRVTLSLEC